jgi:steroid 5-alpha reductase family enzyme
MLGELISRAMIVLLVYMSLWFAVAKARKQLNYVDAAWGGGFVLTAWLVATDQPSARTLLLAILISLWGLRIAYHLTRRVLKSGEDPRYQEMSKKWGGAFWPRAYLSVFILQGALILLICLPVFVITGEQNSDLAALSVLGTAIWFAGFAIESIADWQLKDFLSDKANKGKVMDQGLWRYSRHPNYLGELTQWWAIGIIALQVHNGWIGLLGPLTLTILIVFVSGIPPIEKRKKSDPAYAEYMRKTSPLILWPPKA